MKTAINRAVARIRETSKAIGVAYIQVLFTDVNVFINILFLLLNAIVPTLPFKTYMIDISLDISINGPYVSSAQGQRHE